MGYVTSAFIYHKNKTICPAWYIDIGVRGDHMVTIAAGKGS